MRTSEQEAEASISTQRSLSTSEAPLAPGFLRFVPIEKLPGHRISTGHPVATLRSRPLPRLSVRFFQKVTALVDESLYY
jgi:hypothetical protein